MASLVDGDVQIDIGGNTFLIDLANTIIADLDNVIHSILGFGDEDYNLYVCSEGL